MNLFRNVVIPEAVAKEFAWLVERADRFHALRIPEWVQIQSPSVTSIEVQGSRIDRGELAALNLALEINADAILLDERHARRVAIEIGLKTLGVLGVLLQAKRMGMIDDVHSLLRQLMEQANFWVSPTLRKKFLLLAGEG